MSPLPLQDSRWVLDFFTPLSLAHSDPGFSQIIIITTKIKQNKKKPSFLFEPSCADPPLRLPPIFSRWGLSFCPNFRSVSRESVSGRLHGGHHTHHIITYGLLFLPLLLDRISSLTIRFCKHHTQSWLQPQELCLGLCCSNEYWCKGVVLGISHGFWRVINFGLHVRFFLS